MLDVVDKLLQSLLGGLEQFMPFTPPLLGQKRIKARHQAFIGKLRASDLHQRVRFQGRAWQLLLVNELAHLLGAQGGNPTDSRMTFQRLNLRLGEHAPITH